MAQHAHAVDPLLGKVEAESGRAAHGDGVTVGDERLRLLADPPVPGVGLVLQGDENVHGYVLGGSGLQRLSRGTAWLARRLAISHCALTLSVRPPASGR